MYSRMLFPSIQIQVRIQIQIQRFKTHRHVSLFHLELLCADGTLLRLLMMPPRAELQDLLFLRITEKERKRRKRGECKRV